MVAAGPEHWSRMSLAVAADLDRECRELSRSGQKGQQFEQKVASSKVGRT